MANALQLIGGSVLKGLESHTKERKVIRITDIARKESNMTDKEKTIKELKEALDSLDITNKYRLNLIRAIEYLQEEPVSVWHDANKEEPKKDKAFAIIDSDGVMCAEYHVFEGGLTFKQMKQMDDILKWAYVEDLIPKN